MGRRQQACPCGRGRAYVTCCGRFHRGAAAPTAERLMRSRYSAFALGDAGYLLRTWDPSTRPSPLTLDDTIRWTGLAVTGTSAGGADDAEGTVTFSARYVHAGVPGRLEELSRFRRDGGCWVYVGPVTPAADPPPSP